MGIEGDVTSVESTEIENLGESTTEQIENPVVADTEWSPDYGFRTRDEQREFDDWVKPLVKSKEMEEKFRDLFERAHGLEVVTGDRDALRQHNAQLLEAAQESIGLKAELGEIGELIRSGNVMAVESAFERLNIPDEVVFQYALHKLKLQEADPATQAAYRQQRDREDEFSYLQRQNSELMSQFSNFQVQQRRTELETALSSPDIQNIAREYDQRAGYSGAFRDAVIKEGRYHFMTTQQDLPVSEALQRVASFVGFGGVGAPAPQGQVQPQAGFNRAAGVAVVPPRQNTPPTLPSSRGSGSSPVRKVPRSINDLRQKAQELAAME